MIFLRFFRIDFLFLLTFTCILSSLSFAQTLRVWGDNYSGELGLGSNVKYFEPQILGIDTNWDKISASWGHSFGIKTDGTLWSWGSNHYGQLGLGNKTTYNTPMQVGTDTSWIDVKCTYLNSYGLKENGTIWAWGLGGL
jgi:alpha-tubulin suppressor-like RCC1 family protein